MGQATQHTSSIHCLACLLVLNDGSIIRVYNPMNNTSTDVAEMGDYCAVGLYTGSPLGQLVRLVLQLFMFNI